MRVQPGYGETLPALLRRTRGIPERRTVAAAAALAALLVLAYLLLRDPLQGKTELVHTAKPVFNTLYRKGLVHPVRPLGDEYQRYEVQRGKLRITVTVRPLELPPYKGDAAGLLPVYMEQHMTGLAHQLPGFAVLDEGKARVNKAPGYQVGFKYGTRAHPSTGRDVVVVPPAMPGVRQGVLITLRQTRGRHRLGAAGQALIGAMKSTFRSFKFGADRSG
ncbi:MAG: hypothetical protein QOE86_3003 [Solirubrobacteraceae bacterium]|nr:hypothetical protein [Solirubrobacteraceae bacterium]